MAARMMTSIAAALAALSLLAACDDPRCQNEPLGDVISPVRSEWWDLPESGAGTVTSVDARGFTITTGSGQQARADCCRAGMKHGLKQGQQVSFRRCFDNLGLNGRPLLTLRDARGELLLVGGSQAAHLGAACLPQGLRVSRSDDSCGGSLPRDLPDCGESFTMPLRFEGDGELVLWPGESGRLTIDGHAFRVTLGVSIETPDWPRQCTDVMDHYVSYLVVRE